MAADLCTDRPASGFNDQVDQILSYGVVTTGVVGGVVLAGDELDGVEQLAVSSGTDLIDYCRFQIDEHGTGHVMAGTVSLNNVVNEGLPPPMVSSEDI